MASRKSTSNVNQNAVRKSILRNPEVPLQKENKRVTINDCVCNSKQSEPPKENSSKSLHEPSLNKLNEWKRKMEEIKKFEAKQLENIEMSKDTEGFINRLVSAKLNFPSNHSVFKNLPKIDGESSQNVQKSAPKATVPKKRECVHGLQKMLNELVENEYRNEQLNKKFNLAQSFTDEYLGIDKLKEPAFKLPSQKSETQIYHEQLRKDLYDHLFSCDDFLSTKVNFDPTKEANLRKRDKNCKCMTDFYSEHSMCS